jgi:hypothetical protein
LRGTGVRAVTVHPGGIATNIVNNARFHEDDRGETDRTVLEKDFTKVARTSPDAAARIIQKGVESGKGRILVGYDAKMLGVVLRFAPVGYYEILNRLEPLIRR